MTTHPDPGPVTWWPCEPRRFARDHAEITEHFPNLTWQQPEAGGWTGRLPRWPFLRREPLDLVELIGPDGMEVFVKYGHAYPMVPPRIYPLTPEPDIRERTDHAWHVMGDSSLCLLQDAGAWTGRDSVVDLLLKAAGWRVEYALMKAGMIEAMTLHGIVDDDQLDSLVATVVQSGRADRDGPAGSTGGGPRR